MCGEEDGGFGCARSAVIYKVMIFCMTSRWGLTEGLDYKGGF